MWRGKHKTLSLLSLLLWVFGNDEKIKVWGWSKLKGDKWDLILPFRRRDCYKQQFLLDHTNGIETIVSFAQSACFQTSIWEKMSAQWRKWKKFFLYSGGSVAVLSEFLGRLPFHFCISERTGNIGLLVAQQLKGQRLSKQIRTNCLETNSSKIQLTDIDLSWFDAKCVTYTQDNIITVGFNCWLVLKAP